MAAADTTSIASGIADAGRSIGQGLAMRAADMKRREEEDKRKAEEAKKMRAMAKVLKDDIGLSDSEIQGADSASLKGAIDGYMLSQSDRHQKLQMQRDALAIAGMKMLQRDAEGRKSIPQQLVAGFESRGRGIPAPVSNEAFDQQLTQSTGMPTGVRELIAAHAQAGQELPPGIMDDIIRQQGGRTGADTFIEDDKTGARFLASGNTRLPSGTNPEKFTTVTVTDPNTGLPVELPVNPRTGQALLKPRAPQANRVPPEFTTKLAEMAGGLADPKYKEQVSTSIRAAIDTAHTLKQIDKEQRDALYEQYGLTAGKDKDTSAPAKAGVNADQELKQARNAIAQGRSKAAVAARYKERTGQDFPDE